jgi:hypothetical protein
LIMRSCSGGKNGKKPSQPERLYSIGGEGRRQRSDQD